MICKVIKRYKKSLDKIFQDAPALTQAMDDKDVIEYVQRLLGYGITGRTNEQCWAIFTGSGSNGKGVLISLLKSLMKEWYINAPREVFFKTNKANAGMPPIGHSRRRIAAAQDLPTSHNLGATHRLLQGRHK